MKPYDIVDEFEKVVADYVGSKYAVAVDSCTNALLLCFKLLGTKGETVLLPSKTYVGVAYSVLNAGGKCEFEDYTWEGFYFITVKGEVIIDSARWFTSGIYLPGSLMCFSGHWGKTLKIGRGGIIATDNLEQAEALRVMRFDGRTAGTPPKDDNFILPGHHCYTLPEEAARGLMLMSSMPKDNDLIPADDYTDLSQYPIFQEGYK